MSIRRPDSAVTDPKGIDGKNLITFDSRQWDKVVTGEHSYGWLTRTVYHELVHVMQYQGLFGMKDLSYNMSEFQANYLSVMNNNLPCYNQSEINYYAGKAIGYLANAPNGSGAGLIKQYATVVQTLLNQVAPDVRKKYIITIQQITHTPIKFY